MNLIKFVALVAVVASATACKSKTEDAADSGAPSEPIAIPGPPDDGKVKIEELAPGDGATAQNGDTVKVLYAGKFLDGKEFDSSQKHGGQPYTFPLGAGRAIKGYDLGVVGMKVHGKRRITVPPIARVRRPWRARHHSSEVVARLRRRAGGCTASGARRVHRRVHVT